MQIKETKEAMIGIFELGLVISDLLKDGAQISDASALAMRLLTDSNLKAKLEAAKDKVNEVPEEMKDLSILEAIDLAKTAIEYVPKFVEALKK